MTNFVVFVTVEIREHQIYQESKRNQIRQHEELCLIFPAEKDISVEKLTLYILLMNTFKSNDPKTDNFGTLCTKNGDKEYQKFQKQNIRKLCNYKTSHRDHLKSKRY